MHGGQCLSVITYACGIKRSAYCFILWQTKINVTGKVNTDTEYMKQKRNADFNVVFKRKRIKIQKLEIELKENVLFAIF